MKFQLPDHAFPPLVLSALEQQELIDEADRVIEETIRASDAHIAAGRCVRDDLWKHVRTKEGMNVYRQRSLHAAKKLFDPIDDLGADSTTTDTSVSHISASHSWRGYSVGAKTPASTRMPMRTRTPGSTMSARSARTPGGVQRFGHMAHSVHDRPDMSPHSGTTSTSSHWWMETHKPAHIPAMLAVGTVDGTVEDAMYAVFSEDDASWRWKSSQINDKLDDARVLATIRGPTRDDPFRFIGVKWFTKEHPAALSSIVKRRDFLTIEAMGITSDSQGRRVGYFMMHSVDIPRIPVLSDLDILRGRASFCFILRQSTSNTMDVFARGFSDPVGEMLEAVSVRLASDSILAVIRIVDFAYIKKLRWLILNRQKKEEQAIQLDTGGDSRCKSCHKNVKRFSSMFAAGSSCQVCRDVICSKCTVIKHITVDISVDGATQRPLTFCLPCVIEAKHLPAWDVALADVTQKQYSLLPEDFFPGQARQAGRRQKSASLRRATSDVKELPRSRSSSRNDGARHSGSSSGRRHHHRHQHQHHQAAHAMEQQAHA